MLDGEYTGTIDRIVDGETAVVLLEEDDDVIEQFDIPVDRLPADYEAGSVVSATISNGEIVEVTVRPDETADRRQRIQEKFDRLSKRLDDEE